MDILHLKALQKWRAARAICNALQMREDTPIMMMIPMTNNGDGCLAPLPGPILPSITFSFV